MTIECVVVLEKNARIHRVYACRTYEHALRVSRQLSQLFLDIHPDLYCLSIQKIDTFYMQ